MDIVEFDIVVRRSHVLVDALNRMKNPMFNPTKRFNVEFVDEEGIDGGGLTREFFQLLFQQFSSVYLDGTGCFKHNAVAFQNGIYFRLGQLASMCLVHGGAAIRVFSPSVYSFLCGKRPSDIDVKVCEVFEFGVKDLVNKILESQSDEELRTLLINNCDLVTERGFSKPLAYVRLGDKATIVQTLTLHEVILKSLGETQQFLDGLGALNVAGTLKTHGDLLKEFYCNDPALKTPLTADTLRKMFTTVIYSEAGTNQQQKEENTYMMFLDYLDKCEKVTNESGMNNFYQETEEGWEFTVGEGKVSLDMILSFFTGGKEVPPLGLTPEPQLNFSAVSPYPTASTCVNQLILPTKFDTQLEFQSKMDEALIAHGGFGLP